ncbi:unnamed protein product [Sphacelaria rigidula]
MNATSYGSQVLSSGDLVVRDAILSSQHRVDHSTGLGISSAHSSYVLSQGASQEVSRDVYSLTGSGSEKHAGKYESSCLCTGDNYKTMPVTLETDPEKTRFNTNETSATFSQGLSFNTDESAIYFGRSKTFRLMLNTDTPARLVFQYLDPSSSKYVTKFSCAKS